MRTLGTFVVGLLLVGMLALIGATPTSAAGSGTTTINHGNLTAQGWFFSGGAVEGHTGGISTGNLTSGPGGAGSLGTGSAHFTLGNSGGGEFLATPQFAGTSLSSLTTLSFSTYTLSAGKSVALEFDIDYDPTVPCATLTASSTCYQGRFVFVPAFNNAPQTVTTNVWQAWDTLDPNAKDWYASRAIPGHASMCTQAANGQCSLADMLGVYPNAVIKSRLGAGNFGVKAGSGYSSFDGNMDNIIIGINSVTTTFDFEPGGAATSFVRTDGDDTNCNGRSDAAVTAAPNCGFKTIQNAVNNVVDGDTVSVDAGVYNESPNITKSITLQAPQGRDQTTIALQTQPPATTYLGSLTVTAPDVTVNGFTIKGFDAVGSGLASSNIFVNPGLHNISITNNRLQVGVVGAGSNGDDGIGILTTSTTDPAQLVNSVTVTGNIFTPLNAEGTRAFYINPGVNTFTFQNNQITGNFAGTALTQAKTGLISNNTITGAGVAGSRSAGFGAWGAPDPTIWGHATFQNNTISGTRRGIALYTDQNVAVMQNVFSQNGDAIWLGLADPADPQPDATTITIQQNSFTASDSNAVNNTLTGAINATPNYWGTDSGPTNAANVGGTGATVTANITFAPWCGNSACTLLYGIATKLVFTTQPTGASPGDALGTQPVLQAVDAGGNLGFNFAGPVALVFGANPGGARLGGSTTVNAVHGIATFSGLTASKQGDGYTLAASSSGLTATTSIPFTIGTTTVAPTGPRPGPVSGQGGPPPLPAPSGGRPSPTTGQGAGPVAPVPPGTR